MQNSQSSDTLAGKAKERSSGSVAGDKRIIEACAAAADELAAGRSLIAALDNENAALKVRLATETRTTAVLRELNETRQAEASALRSALDAKNETIAAKDAAIAAQDKLLAALRSKKPSPWRRIGDIMIGAAAVLILK